MKVKNLPRSPNESHVENEAKSKRNAKKDLPEISRNLFAIGRAGLDFGDDDGLLLGAGAGFHLTPKVDVRGEYLAKNASTVYQASLVVNF